MTILSYTKAALDAMFAAISPNAPVTAEGTANVNSAPNGYSYFVSGAPNNPAGTVMVETVPFPGGTYFQIATDIDTGAVYRRRYTASGSSGAWGAWIGVGAQLYQSAAASAATTMAAQPNGICYVNKSVTTDAPGSGYGMHIQYNVTVDNKSQTFIDIVTGKIYVRYTPNGGSPTAWQVNQ